MSVIILLVMIVNKFVLILKGATTVSVQQVLSLLLEALLIVKVRLKNSSYNVRKIHTISFNLLFSVYNLKQFSSL